MAYKKSIFTYIYRNGDEYIFFNSSNLSLLIADKNSFDLYNSLSLSNINDIPEDINVELWKSLLHHEFILDIDTNEIGKEKLRRKARRECAKKMRKNTIGFIRISLTENCNLKCKYCFVNEIYDSKSEIMQHDLVRLLNWFLEIPDNRNPLVQYFGGEPLMKFDEIKACHKILCEYKSNGKIDSFNEEIVTNGTLVTKEIAEYFVENGFQINFSIDGWKEINDINRVDFDGNGSYDKLIEGMRNYKNAGGELSAIVTPTNENMPIFDKIVRFLVEDLGCTEISVNTPQPVDDGWHVDGEKFSEAMKICWQYCIDNSIILNHPGTNIVFLINNKIPQTNSCMNLTYGQEVNTWGIYVTSDMLVSKCVVECDERCTINFENFAMNDDFIDWHFDDTANESCFKCPGLNICGGGCSTEKMLSGGKNNKEKCKYYKSMIPWVIKNHAK